MRIPLRSTEIISTEKGVFMNASGTDERRSLSWLIVLEWWDHSWKFLPCDTCTRGGRKHTLAMPEIMDIFMFSFKIFNNLEVMGSETWLELLFYSFTVIGETVHLGVVYLYFHAYYRTIVMKRMWRNHLLLPLPKDRMKHIFTIPNIYYWFNRFLKMFGDGISCTFQGNSLQCLTILTVKNYFKGKSGIMLSKLHDYWTGWMKWWNIWNIFLCVKFIGTLEDYPFLLFTMFSCKKYIWFFLEICLLSS